MNKAKTTEQFIEDALTVHNNSYDYSLVRYKNCYTNVSILCPIHGVFEQSPNNHLIGKGCPICRKRSNTPLARKRSKNGIEYDKIRAQVRQESRLLGSSKRSALRRGLEHTIVLSDIVIPEYCPLLGIKLTNIMGKGIQPTNASIDRIDNNIGYVPGNIQIISDLANKMKSSATPEQLVTFAESILRIYKNNDNLCPIK